MRQYRKIAAFVRQISDYQVSLYAANAAFYIILAFFPAVMLVVSLLPLVGFSQNDLLSAIQGIIPDVLTPFIERVFHDMSANSSVTLVSVTALIAVWSSSRGIFCIQDGINAIHGIDESRSYLRRRIISMVYMILFLVALLLTLVALGFGQEVAAYFAKQDVPLLQILAGIMQLRGLVLLILLSALFCAIYCVFPNRKVSLRSSLPGALLAALGWLVFSLGFSLYVRYFSNYSVLYGSLSTLALGMLWLYICISIVFYGCVLNQLLEKRKKS